MIARLRKSKAGLRSRRRQFEQGNVLVLVLVTSVVVTVGIVALAARTNSGVFAAVFQAKNREARDVAESAVTKFIDLLNRSNNRYLLAAGNSADWTKGLSTASAATLDTSLLNPCTQYSKTSFAKLTTPTDVFDPAQSNKLDPDVDNFRAAAGWKNFVSGDSSRQYQIEKIEYLDKDRNPYSVSDTTIRNDIKTGIARGLIRVTIQAKVVRNGQTSLARVARELEVVPKCCFRSFGSNKNGGGEWGRDERECKILDPNSGGLGIIGALDGVGPKTSKNDLTIIGEDGKKIATSTCWAGNVDGSSELTGTPDDDCISGDLALGGGGPSKVGVSMVPTQFNYVRPNPRFSTGGCLNVTGGVCTISGLPALTGVADDYEDLEWTNASGLENRTLNDLTFTVGGVPTPPSPGNWIKDTVKKVVWVAGYPQKAVDPSCAAPVGAPTACDPLNWYKVSEDNFNASISTGGSLGSIPNSSLVLSSSQDSYLRYNSSDKKAELCQLIAGKLVGCTAVASCYSMIGNGGVGPSPYAQINCNLQNFRYSGGAKKDVYVDTTLARFNIYFSDSSGNYLDLGTGSASLYNVHCTTSSTSPCATRVTWANFQKDCLLSGGDPLCTATNRPYDTGELFNFYAIGAGIFSIQGGSTGAGFNVYAPKSEVSLKGGGSAGDCVSGSNFMGRLWANKVTLSGNISICALNSAPSTCTSVTCPISFRYIYDMKARSYTQASGF